MTPDNAKILRDHIEDDIKQRQAKMLEEFKSEFLLKAVQAAIAAGDFTRLPPEPEAMEQAEQGELTADKVVQTDAEEAGDRTESDPIRLNPTTEVARSEPEGESAVNDSSVAGAGATVLPPAIDDPVAEDRIPRADTQRRKVA